MSATRNAHPQLIAYPEPAIYNLGGGKSYLRGAFGISKLITRVLGQYDCARRDGRDDGMSVVRELGGFANELGNSR